MTRQANRKALEVFFFRKAVVDNGNKRCKKLHQPPPLLRSQSGGDLESANCSIDRIPDDADNPGNPYRIAHQLTVLKWISALPYKSAFDDRGA
ncbi:MAG: hypothetical protein C1942_01510 [Prosthecochloris sp.]|nr:hypothetical protein [Prosthecochloris sp.]